MNALGYHVDILPTDLDWLADQCGLISCGLYIAAWREHEKIIWYEYVGARFLALLGCERGQVDEVFRQSIVDRRLYRYAERERKVEEEIVTRAELCSGPVVSLRYLPSTTNQKFRDGVPDETKAHVITNCVRASWRKIAFIRATSAPVGYRPD